MECVQLSKRQLGIILLVIIIIAVSIYFVARLQSDRTIAQSDAGRVFSDTASTTLLNERGEEVSFNVRDRQVAVLAFWATWVPESPALLATVDVVAAATEYSNVRFLAVNRSEPAPRMEAFFRKAKRPDTLELVTDVNDSLFAGLESYAMPEIVIFDQDGGIAWRKRGNVTEAELRAALDALKE